MMHDSISLKEAIEKAKYLKENGGVKPIYVGFSNSKDDPLVKAHIVSRKIIEKL